MYTVTAIEAIDGSLFGKKTFDNLDAAELFAEKVWNTIDAHVTVTDDEGNIVSELEI